MTYLTAPCIDHIQNDYFAIARNCYHRITGDFVSAVLLGVFEFWSNGMLAATKQTGPNVNLGKRSLQQINAASLDVGGTTRIRKKLQELAKKGFIQIVPQPGGVSEYWFCPQMVQAAIRAAFPLHRSNLTPAKVQEGAISIPASSQAAPAKEENPVIFEGVNAGDPVIFEGVSLYIKERSFKEKYMGVFQSEDMPVAPSPPILNPATEENIFSVHSNSVEPTGEDQLSGAAGFPIPNPMGKLSSRRGKSAPTLFPDEFEVWWKQWLAGFKLAKRASKPDRGAAVKAWGQAISWGLKEGYESEAEVVAAIAQGSELFWQSKLQELQDRGVMIGVPDPERFLRGSQHHPTPYWQTELDALEEEVDESIILALTAPSEGKKGANQTAISIPPAARPPRVDLSVLYPEGPWLTEAGRLNEDFVRDRAKVWRTGDMPSAKSFAAMAIEDVMGIIAGHYLKNPAKLEIDWQSYAAKNQRYISNVAERVSAGVEISPQEQQEVVSKLPVMQGYQAAYEQVEPALPPQTVRQRLTGARSAQDKLEQLNQWLKDDCLRNEAIRRVMASDELEFELDDEGSYIGVRLKANQNREVA